MALNTTWQPSPWQRGNEWQQAASSGAHAISQGFQAGIQQKRFQQEMALRLKQLEVENEQVTVMNQLRLQQIEDTRNQVLDKEPLANWAKDPSQPLPSFRSLKTYQAANQIAEQYSRSQAGQAWQATQKQFYERFGDLSGDDQATVMDMLRQSNGQVTSDIFKFSAQAYDRRPRETATITEVREITRLRQQADAIRATDTAKADAFLREAAILESRVAGAKKSIRMTDAAGNVVEVLEGQAPTADITTANKTRLQQDIQNTNDLLDIAGDLKTNLQWKDVGVAGVAGEWVLDRLLPQFGVSSEDAGRMDRRTKLKTLAQGSLRQISPDNRFTNEDRQRVEEIVPSSGIFESEAHAKQALATIGRVFARRNIRDRLALGQTLDMPNLTNEEIGAAVEMGKLPYETAFEFLKNNR